MLVWFQIYFVDVKNSQDDNPLLDYSDHRCQADLEKRQDITIKSL